MYFIKALLTMAVATALPLTAQASNSPSSQKPAARIKEHIGTAGSFLITSSLAFGLVKEGETILRLPSAPKCLLQLGSASSPLAFGGTLAISGDAVGQPGGLAAPLTITPSESDPFYVGVVDEGSALYARATGQRVKISLQGAGSVSKMPLTVLRSPRFADEVRVTSPTPTETGEIVANAADGLTLTWNVPSGPLRKQKLIATLFSFASESMIGELRCGFDLAAGTASVPAQLMTALKNRLGDGPAYGFIHVRTGDFKIVRVGKAAYTVEVAHDDGATFDAGADTPMTIQ